MAQKIVTVLGDIAPSELGRTLTHEHLSMQFDVCFVQPEKPELADLDWTLGNYGWIWGHPYSHKSNIVLNDAAGEASVLNSVKRFKGSGGGAIVENSTFGLQRKNSFLKRLSRETGVKVVAGTGYYVNGAQTSDTLGLSEERMADFMKGEMMEGCHDDKSVRCGLVGEIGVCTPMHDFERRSIRASAAVQEDLKCCVSFHPGRHKESPFEIMRIFQEAGGEAGRTIMGHLERTLPSAELSEFADLGTYCQFDLFGIELSYYQFADCDFPSDAQRMDFIRQLCDERAEDRILVAHDIHTKHRLEEFGGHGYSHLLNTAVPKMLKVKGVTQSQIDKILIDNPAKALACNPQ